MRETYARDLCARAEMSDCSGERETRLSRRAHRALRVIAVSLVWSSPFDETERQRAPRAVAPKVYAIQLLYATLSSVYGGVWGTSAAPHRLEEGQLTSGRDKSDLTSDTSRK